MMLSYWKYLHQGSKKKILKSNWIKIFVDLTPSDQVSLVKDGFANTLGLMRVVMRPPKATGFVSNDTTLHDPEALRAARRAHDLPHGHGSLPMFVGPMFAGKTSALMTVATFYLSHRRRILTFKPSQDTRM